MELRDMNTVKAFINAYHQAVTKDLINKDNYISDEDYDVHHFRQTWGDTSLGFGGVGGQTVTDAWTTVIHNLLTDTAAVYLNGRLCYTVDHPNSKFWNDVRDWTMVAKQKAGQYATASKQRY